MMSHLSAEAITADPLSRSGEAVDEGGWLAGETPEPSLEAASSDPPGRGKVALVTGGARRVGKAVALSLARAGMDLAITYRQSAQEAQQVVEQIRAMGRRAWAIEADLALPNADERIWAELTRRFDRLDALVNNASIFHTTPLGRIDPAAFESFMTVNALAPLLLIQRLAPWLGAHYRQGDPASAGRVVNLVDVHVLGQPMARYAAYNASKAALLEITRTCAVELAPAVTVNAVAPGVVAWAASADEAYRRQYLERVPLARAGTPEDAAEAVRFLILQAHYCTGQIIRVDGGRSLT